MEDVKSHKLLKNRKVVEEINRHLWIESEKAGYDIGFEKAAQDWLQHFSQAWMDYHMPKRQNPSGSQNGSSPEKAQKSSSKSPKS